MGMYQCNLIQFGLSYDIQNLCGIKLQMQDMFRSFYQAVSVKFRLGHTNGIDN